MNVQTVIVEFTPHGQRLRRPSRQYVNEQDPLWAPKDASVMERVQRFVPVRLWVEEDAVRLVNCYYNGTKCRLVLGERLMADIFPVQRDRATTILDMRTPWMTASDGQLCLLVSW